MKGQSQLTVRREKKEFFVAEVYGKQIHMILTFLLSEFEKKIHFMLRTYYILQ